MIFKHNNGTKTLEPSSDAKYGAALATVAVHHGHSFEEISIVDGEIVLLAWDPMPAEGVTQQKKRQVGLQAIDVVLSAPAVETVFHGRKPGFSTADGNYGFYNAALDLASGYSLGPWYRGHRVSQKEVAFDIYLRDLRKKVIQRVRKLEMPIYEVAVALQRNRTLTRSEVEHFMIFPGGWQPATPTEEDLAVAVA